MMETSRLKHWHGGPPTTPSNRPAGGWNLRIFPPHSRSGPLTTVKPSSSNARSSSPIPGNRDSTSPELTLAPPRSSSPPPPHLKFRESLPLLPGEIGLGTYSDCVPEVWWLRSRIRTRENARPYARVRKVPVELADDRNVALELPAEPRRNLGDSAELPASAVRLEQRELDSAAVRLPRAEHEPAHDLVDVRERAIRREVHDRPDRFLSLEHDAAAHPDLLRNAVVVGRLDLFRGNRRRNPDHVVEIWRHLSVGFFDQHALESDHAADDETFRVEPHPEREVLDRRRVFAFHPNAPPAVLVGLARDELDRAWARDVTEQIALRLRVVEFLLVQIAETLQRGNANRRRRRRDDEVERFVGVLQILVSADIRLVETEDL